MKRSLSRSRLTWVLCCGLLIANIGALGQKQGTPPTKGTPAQGTAVKHQKKRKGKVRAPKHKQFSPGSNNPKELKDLKDKKDREKFGK